MTVNEIKKYRKKAAYSYSFDSFPTFELLQTKPEVIEMILVHSNIKIEIENKLKSECEKAGIKLIHSDRHIEKVRDKDNCIVIGVFKKYHCKLDHSDNHVVLVNPSDTGNLGTIIRSCMGFGITNLAIIEPAVDVFHPKVVRASMGAVFQMNFEYFSCFNQYDQKYGNEREYYPFMLNGMHQLGTFEHSGNQLYSLIFGNDSLNLSLAVGIGIYEFCKPRRKEGKNGG